MTGAHRHAKFLEIQKQMWPAQTTLELERSCDVRLSSWSNAVSKVLTLLGPILETLATFSQSSGQTKLEADSLLHQMQTIVTMFLLVTFNQLFDVSDFATKDLQSSTLSVADCIDLTEGLKDSYTVMALTDELMDKHEIVCLDIRRKLPARLSKYTLFLLWANHYLYSKTQTYRNYGMTYWTADVTSWTPVSSQTHTALWETLLPACHGQTPLVTRLSFP